MKLLEAKWRYGNLSLDPAGNEIDRERSILPTLVYAGHKLGNDRFTVLGTGWWKWGISLTVHWRIGPEPHAD